MILPPFSSPKELNIDLQPIGVKEEEWFIFFKDRLLVDLENKSFPKSSLLPTENTLFLGTFKEKHLFASWLKEEVEAPLGWSWSGLRALHTVYPEDLFSLSGRALQLVHWDRTHQYCGQCGTKTFTREQERCKECPACGHLEYPKLSTAIVVLIRREGKILLARSPHFPAQQFSVLAGFLDPGETLEQCVMREVYEEVGIQVDNIRYFGSQPWPLSRSLMIGFTCDWKEGKIKINLDEIEAADWFGKDNLPLLPAPISLSRILIDSAFT